MITGIGEIYTRYLKMNRGTEYVFARLWEEYDDDYPDEKMVVYNLIIAQRNIEENVITNNNWKCIIRALKSYEDNLEKVSGYFSGTECRKMQYICDEIRKRTIAENLL